MTQMKFVAKIACLFCYQFHDVDTNLNSSVIISQMHSAYTLILVTTFT